MKYPDKFSEAAAVAELIARLQQEPTTGRGVDIKFYADQKFLQMFQVGDIILHTDKRMVPPRAGFFEFESVLRFVGLVNALFPLGEVTAPYVYALNNTHGTQCISFTHIAWTLYIAEQLGFNVDAMPWLIAAKQFIAGKENLLWHEVVILEYTASPEKFPKVSEWLFPAPTELALTPVKLNTARGGSLELERVTDLDDSVGRQWFKLTVKRPSVGKSARLKPVGGVLTSTSPEFSPAAVRKFAKSVKAELAARGQA